MKKTFVFAAALAVIVLAGCQGANNAANTATDGNAASTSGSQKVTAVVSDDDLGITVRPAEAPADLPSPDMAYDFNYLESGVIVSFSYKVKNDNLLSVCDDVETKLKAAGWERSTEGMNSEDADNIYRQFANDKYKLTESCSLTDNVPDIALIRNTKK